MDSPLNYVPASEIGGYFAAGLLAGFVIASVYWYVMQGRAMCRLADLRACFPSWRFERRGPDIVAHRPGGRERYVVGTRITSFPAVCEKMERVLEYEKEIGRFENER